MNTYIVRRNSLTNRFEVVNSITNAFQSQWGSLMDARKAAADLNA